MSSEYFDYLCRIVGRKDIYSTLLRKLYSMEFYPIVPYDDNRCVDGIHLREQYTDFVGAQAPSLVPGGKCKILEMLIALAIRLEFELAQSEYEQPARKWFWLLIENLDLLKAKDGTSYLASVESKIKILVERSYNPNGRGGLFPLRYPKRDQRDVEIWYQMTDYILENYSFM